MKSNIGRMIFSIALAAEIREADMSDEEKPISVLYGLKAVFLTFITTAARKFAVRQDINTIIPAVTSLYTPIPTIPVTKAGPLL